MLHTAPPSAVANTYATCMHAHSSSARSDSLSTFDSILWFALVIPWSQIYREETLITEG
jgi:hypothetical protein